MPLLVLAVIMAAAGFFSVCRLDICPAVTFFLAAYTLYQAAQSQSRWPSDKELIDRNTPRS